jgi:hypothetical protein
VTRKSEPVEPFHEEEKAEEKPETPLNEEPAMNKAPVPDVDGDSVDTAGVAEDREYEAAMKTLNERFAAIEARGAATEKALGEVLSLLKANYTSKLAPRDSDYPTPGEDGPLSDGMQAPRLTQNVNPHSKAFGKGQKTALGPATDGEKSGRGFTAGVPTEILERALTTRVNAAQMTSIRKNGGL